MVTNDLVGAFFDREKGQHSDSVPGLQITDAPCTMIVLLAGGAASCLRVWGACVWLLSAAL